MILLDTNAVIWHLAGHERAAPLVGASQRLYVSPASLLELKFLLEVGRLEAAEPDALDRVVRDPRWQLDSPSSDALFRAAFDIEWSRDPFDRLIVAHASLRRWRLATGDRNIVAHVPATALLRL